MSLDAIYALRHKYVLKDLAKNIEDLIAGYLREEPRVDRICARAKSIDRFLQKAQKTEDGNPKYDDPISQIQDQIGARIVTFYTSDVDHISAVIEKYMRPVESKQLVPESDWSFGYFGKHYVLLIPTDALDPTWDKEQIPTFFELQIKTLYQHAWAEANHDLGYKPGLRELTADELRRLAFTAAQSWGADEIFDNLFKDRS